MLQPLVPELAPNESEARFRALAEASWEGICFSDNGVILDANPQLASILGYELHELIGKNVLNLIAPVSMASIIRAMRVRTSAVNEFQALRKDGSIVTIEVRAQTVLYRGREVRMTAVRDVTERARMAEHRKALVAGTAGVAGEHFFRSLVKHLARAMEARCAFVAELVDQNQRLSFLSAWDGDGHVTMVDAAISSTVMQEVIGGGLRFFDGDVAHQFDNDAVLADLDISSCAAIALQDASGLPIGVLAVAGDRPLQIDDNLVSTLRVFAARAGVEIERIHTERQIRKFNQELEKRVADRTGELERANQELEAFSYSVSHDLRAPLRQVLGFADLLRRDLGERTSPGVRQHVTDIEDSARKMSTLIETLLEFSRVGRAGLSLATVDLNGIVHDVIADLKRDAGDRQIDFVVRSLPRLRCDAELIRQVFVNLIGNAVKFTRPRERAVIEIGTQVSDADGVACYVRDNGVGFNPLRAGKLFCVFQRLHSPSLFEGSGIGLANVQRIILRHGGRVWAAGEVERGATFYFSLPARVEEE